MDGINRKERAGRIERSGVNRRQFGTLLAAGALVAGSGWPLPASAAPPSTTATWPRHGNTVASPTTARSAST